MLSIIYMHKMVKTYNICVIMNLNKEYVLKPIFLQSTAYIFAGILMYVLLYARPIAMGVFRGTIPMFFMPRKVRFKHVQ